MFAALVALFGLVSGTMALADSTTGDIVGAETISKDVVAGAAFQFDSYLFLTRQGAAASSVTWTGPVAQAGTCTSITGTAASPSVMTVPTGWSGMANGTRSIARKADGTAAATPAEGVARKVTISGAAGTAGGFCKLRWSGAGGGIGDSNVDLTVNFVAPIVTNTAPSTPGAPSLSSGFNPNKTGEFTLGWAASADNESDPIKYTLEHKDGDDAAWSQVATDLTAASYTFATGNAEPEGTWTYRVKASDGSLESASSAASAGIVVDKTAPGAPAISADRAPDFPGNGGWFKNTVTVTFASNGDPALQDTSAGSGVDLATVPAPQTKSTSGSHSVSGTVKDSATNESVLAALTVQVDATNPAVVVTCPTAPVIKGSAASASWAASDAHSGIATSPAGSISLDTSTVGNRTAAVAAGTAKDNVGLESAAATCAYSVIYNWTGFFSPVDNPSVLNVARAGSAIPVKFSLGGDQGLAVMAAGYPTSNTAACDAAATDDVVEETSTAGQSSLSYDPVTDRYNYVWKTDKNWAGQCRQLRVKLVDGTLHVANFKLTK